MVIDFNGTILCAGDSSAVAGDPTGPDKLSVKLTPGTEDYEYVDAVGIDAEHVGCDVVGLSFSVVRTYATLAAARDAVVSLTASAPREGALSVDSRAFIAKAALKDMTIRQVGCSLVINYSIEGF